MNIFRPGLSFSRAVMRGVYEVPATSRSIISSDSNESYRCQGFAAVFGDGRAPAFSGGRDRQITPLRLSRFASRATEEVIRLLL